MAALESAQAPARRLISPSFIGQFGVIGAILLMIGVFGIADPDFFSNFFHPNNIANIGRQTTLLLITSFAMTFIILAGEIDISIGAIASASSVVIALLITQGQPAILAILSGVGLGALLGLVNGIITVKGRIPSFIVTLGMLNIIQGLALAATNASTITLPNRPWPPSATCLRAAWWRCPAACCFPTRCCSRWSS
jgi:ribose transport system permease protein